MRQPLLILLSTLSLAGCASGGGKLPVCDGKHLRPGNPYGSVLAPTEGAAAPSVGAAEGKPKTLSAVSRPAVFGSCA